MEFTKEQIERMRFDLAHPETVEMEFQLIEKAKKIFAEQGRNFDAEFAAWMKNRDK